MMLFFSLSKRTLLKAGLHHVRDGTTDLTGIPLRESEARSLAYHTVIMA